MSERTGIVRTPETNPPGTVNPGGPAAWTADQLATWLAQALRELETSVVAAQQGFKDVLGVCPSFGGLAHATLALANYDRWRSLHSGEDAS